MDRKERILLYLKSRASATLGELAADLALSKQGTLRHLEALIGHGLIARREARPGAGPGRPAHVYQLTAAAAQRFPQRHRELVGELVDFLEDDQLERFFKARAARVEAGYASRLAGLDWNARVRELARLASEHGHMTEVVERTDGSLALRHCNCPIQDVAALTPHPCRHEKEMYGRLLDSDVIRSTWQGNGDSSCTYEIANEGKATLNG